MNKRIRELMLEAGYAAPEHAERAQKLAELLVQECALIFWDEDSYYGKWLGDAMKRRLGVEDDQTTAT